jgi:EmrB/QacA subfamily drug resistance transporter
VIGGLIVDSVSWRWLFFVNVPIAILALALARRFLAADLGRADAGRLDWIGVALLSPGLAAIVFGLSEMESHGGIGAPISVAPIALGALLVALFCRHALRTARPLVDLRLFRSAHFSAAAATTFLLGGALFGAMLVVPLYYQVARGEAALTAGLLMAPQGIGAAIAMPFSGRLVDRIGGGRVAVVGCTIMTLATMPLAFVDARTSFVLLAGVLVVRGIGLGAAMMPSLAAAYSRLDRAQVPRATGVLTALQRVGGSIGTALLAVILQRQTSAALASAGGSSGLQPITPTIRAQLADPLAAGFAHTFAWAAGMTAVAIIPAALVALTEWSRHASDRPANEGAVIGAASGCAS